MSTQSFEAAVCAYDTPPLLLTVGDAGPHTCIVEVEIDGRTVGCIPSKSAAKNMLNEPNISFVWPAREPGGYAIVANGHATIHAGADNVARAKITLTKTVLHRPGPKPEGRDGPCASDCIQLQ